jgi:hypothetical protein
MVVKVEVNVVLEREELTAVDSDVGVGRGLLLLHLPRGS